MNPIRRPAFAISLIAICAGTLCAAGLFSLNSRAADNKPANAPKPAMTVTTTLPQSGAWPLQLDANGNIAAWQEAVIGSEASGLRLTEVRVNVGDAVKKGQVLATFAPEPVQADVAQARANLVEAEANASDASGNAERARTLQATGALSTQQINQYLTTAETAKARVEAARATLAAQQLRLRQTQVLAPDAGVISARNATVGAVLASGTELFRLIRGGRLEWRAEVTSSELGRIQPGGVALVTTPGGTQLRGKVRMIAPTVDAQTRNALVYVDLPPVNSAAAASARPGMFARGAFQLGSSPALTVPQLAVVARDGFNYVFRVTPQSDNPGLGRVQQLKIQTGRQAGDRTEVTGGLPADARLVVTGAGFLNDGDLVRINDGGTAAPAQAAASAAR
ncbi:efflux transporter periplasmic adaptor subunit [Rhodoferax koreense]|uniref:Efflux transporter periplasmic adaptor subunit n=1 Tax=Rhodoferax koreensis TaxID=1842727 RepID=A0A1P8K2J8_9BURK|nr:efflux RND transporter periplasmic adaptor subunit [Rhodoferax koreense]APW40161.1 efflux transporter periplasmic adaptor subunit [Rhodoferax koreense]